MIKRKPHFRKGNFIRGTVVKPKYFKEKMVVDLDFKTKSLQDDEGKMVGRENVSKGYEKVPVLRSEEGLILGRIPKLHPPFPKSYPIHTRQKGRIRTKRIPVLQLEHFS